MTLETPAAPVGQREPAERNYGYDLLRIIAICGVVSIHTFGSISVNPAVQGTPTAMIALVLGTGFAWTVPVFVMLSGALTLAPRAHRDGPGEFYRRRAIRIVPALAFWTVVYLLLRRWLRGDPLPEWDTIAMIYDNGVYAHLYFLWLIAGLYLVAPVIHAFLDGGGRRRSLIVAAVVLGFTLVGYSAATVLTAVGYPHPVPQGALAIWLFYIGYFIAGRALDGVRPVGAALIACCVGIVALGALTIAQVASTDLHALSYLSPPEYLGTIVAVLSICVFLAGGSLLSRIPIAPRLGRFIVTLSEAAFGVYLVHLVVTVLPNSLLPGFQARVSLPQAAIAYVFILVVSFAISVVARRIPVVRLVF